MAMSICVFCASSSNVDPAFFEVAQALGRRLAQRSDTLVYGGGDIGLMGVMARACHDCGGHIVGVIPDSMRQKELAYEAADELIVTDDMRDRKTIMEKRAQAFICLPGGFGTLEELIEILTLKQLHYHQKPIVLINTQGFWDKLLEVFEQFFAEGFAKEKHRDNYHVVSDVDGALAYIDAKPCRKTS